MDEPDAVATDPTFDPARVQAGIVELLRTALRAASSLEEVIEVAEAAAALGDVALAREVAARIADELQHVLASSGAWEAELTYSKIDAWAQTGHRAKSIAKAWGLVWPLLQPPAGPSRPKDARR